MLSAVITSQSSQKGPEGDFSRNSRLLGGATSSLCALDISGSVSFLKIRGKDFIDAISGSLQF